MRDPRNEEEAELIRLAPSIPLLLPLVFSISSSLGQNTDWQRNPATAGNWFDQINWSAGVPVSNPTARVNNGGEALIGDVGANANFLLVGDGQPAIRDR